MKHGISTSTTLAGLCLLFWTSLAAAQAPGDKMDVFKGKLFAPKVILEHQDELNLSKEQFTAIRAAVVEVQTSVAGYEWDLREAFQRVLSDLDETPIDEDKVLDSLQEALQAENEVKKRQVAMLIKLRNLLTNEQIHTLQQIMNR